MRIAILVAALALLAVPAALAQTVITGVSPDTLYVDEGTQGSFTVTITEAEVGGAWIELSAAGTAVSVPASITIPYGETSGEVPVDGLVPGEATVTAMLGLSYASVLVIVQETDSDGDGLADGAETGFYGSDPLDADTDNDGLNDGAEVLTHGTSPIDADSDDDGLGDGEELLAFGTDPLQFDGDGDGLGDGQELGRASGILGGTSDGTGVPYAGTSAGIFVPDAQPATHTDPLDYDTDDDGLWDGQEDRNHNGAVNAGECNPVDRDTDDDGRQDGAEDADGNGVLGPDETDPLDFDTDADGLGDGLELGVTIPVSGGLSGGPPSVRVAYVGTAAGFTPDADPLTTTLPRDADTDDDGLPDGFEDADHDGMVDPGELDPLLADTDGDNIDDGVETDGGAYVDTDNDGIIDALDDDSDDDGYLDGDPLEGTGDDDGDGVPNYRDPDTPGGDTDGDGLLDALELALGTDPALPDTDGDGRSDYVETDGGSPVDTDGDGLIDAVDTDSDDDSVPDADEVVGDTDGDGVADYRDDDDDNDTIPTAAEGSDDADGDGVPNYLDLDSDDDGYPDADEAAAGSDPYDAGSTPANLHDPRLVSIADVGNDQGRRVRLHWQPSDLDAAGSPQPIVSYSVYRRVDDYKAAVVAGSAVVTHGKAAGAWDFVLNLPAAGEPDYRTLAATLCDSTDAGVCWSAFFVRAHTAAPTEFYDSAPDSGYSVDNLAPAVPAGLQVAYGADNELTWLASEDDDFRYFRIYRATVADFAPDPAFLVGATAGTAFTDPAAGHDVHYLITAVDFAGNESPAAAPQAVSAAGDGVPRAGELAQNTPNPFNPRTTIGLALARTEPVTLTIHDVGGRRVRTLLSGDVLPAGEHRLVWDGCDDRGRPAGAGVYLYSVTTPSFTATKRMALIR